MTGVLPPVVRDAEKESRTLVKVPLADTERRLLRDLFDPRRAAISFPQQTAEAARIHDQLRGHDEVDLPRADVTALADLLGQYLNRLTDTGAPVPSAAPLDDTLALVEHAPTLQHIHAQLVRHLRATE
jgi:hypothetical protein